MKLSYELNPPKIVKGGRFDLIELTQDMKLMSERALQLVSLVDGIHLTDSVLGIPRVSSVTAAAHIRRAATAWIPNESRSSDFVLSCSVRVRDRNFISISQFASDAIFEGIDNLLILIGDEPADKPGDSGLKPSLVVKMLRSERFDSRIKLSLSIPNKIKNVSSSAIRNKIDARPDSFVTQSIASLSDLGEIVDIAKQHMIQVIACVMVPSEKNKQSANMIGLNWREYERNAVDFVKEAAKVADEILLSSPNSFRSGLELLSQLKG